MISVEFHCPGEIADGELKYAVIVAKYQDQWVLCRHGKRSTWEIPGGHRELGESIDDAALRELQEETGAIRQDLHRIMDYGVTRTEESNETTTFGALYYAEILELGPLDPESEIAEIAFFSCLPDMDQLTYPLIQPELHIKAQVWLNLRSSSDEIWDVYDAERRPTGRTHRRGDLMKRGDYHLVVHVWLQNSKGQFLITKRAPSKGFPNMWECTGGSALAGDDSVTAAVREVKEETGLDVTARQGKLIFQFQRPDNFTDVWLFPTNASLEEVVLQAGETTETRFASADEIMDLYRQGVFVPFYYMDQFSTLIQGKVSL